MFRQQLIQLTVAPLVLLILSYLFRNDFLVVTTYAKISSSNRSSTLNNKKCAALGQSYDGTEDISVYRHGMAFAGIGLQMLNSDAKAGVIMGINTNSIPPTYNNLTITGGDMPSMFRPHGLYIANSTSSSGSNNDRLFVVSHEHEYGAAGEESIFVFDIIMDEDTNSKGNIELSDTITDDTWPSLEFKYKLISSAFPDSWFLNDLVVLPGRNELFVTQFWQDPTSDNTDTFIHRCVWSEEDLSFLTDHNNKNVGAIDATCEKAHTRASSGYNGITMSTDGTRLWANDLRMGKLVAFDIDTNSDDTLSSTTLTLSEKGCIDLRIPVTTVDNIELDHASGDIVMADSFLGCGVTVPRCSSDTTQHNNNNNEYHGRLSFRIWRIDSMPLLPFLHNRPSVATYANDGITLVGFYGASPIYYCVV